MAIVQTFYFSEKNTENMLSTHLYYGNKIFVSVQTTSTLVRKHSFEDLVFIINQPIDLIINTLLQCENSVKCQNGNISNRML